MKASHIFAVALIALPLFCSCGGDEPDTPTPPTPPTPVDPPTPPEPEKIEFRRTFRFDDNIISMNGSNDYVAVYDKEKMTKSGDSREIDTGTFTFDNASKTYTLNGLGKLEIVSDSKIAFTPTGGSKKEYDAKVSLIVSDESSNASLMNRTWVINETILTFRGVNYTFKGLDLNEVEKKARDEGVEFKFHLDDGMVVTKVIITDSLIAAEFKNGQSYAAEHTLRSGNSFSLSEFTNGLEGTAKVQFVDELCTITINTTLDESPASIILTMQEKK